MSFIMVIPSVSPISAHECLKTYTGEYEDCYVIPNNETNRGVAGAWNLGVDQMFAQNKDWLVICSESIRFGADGYADLKRELDEASDNTMAVEADDDLGWHLIAFRKEVFEKVGYFDELFYPAYYEDNDFSYRYQLAFKTTEEDYPLWPKVHIDATLIGKAQGLQHVEPIDFTALERAYEEKWGGVSPHETFLRPYDNAMFTFRYVKRR